MKKMKRLTTVAIASLAFVCVSGGTIEAKNFLKRLPVIKRIGSYRESLELKQHVASQNAEISELNATVEQRDETIANRNDRIAQQGDRLAKQTDSISRMQSNLKNKTEMIASQKEAIAALPM